MEELLFISSISLCFCVLFSIRTIIVNLNRKLISGYLFIIPVIIIFYIMPIFLDYIFNLKFDNYYYIYDSMSDDKTTFSYNLYISCLLLFFSIIAKRTNTKILNYQSFVNETSQRLVRFYDKYWLILWVLIIVPFVYVYLFGDIDYYSTYLTRAIIYSGNIPESHNIINKLSLISTFIIAFIITVLIYKNKLQKKFIFHLIIILIGILILHFWIDGKRGIVAKYGATQLILLLISNSLTIRKGILTGFVSLFVFIGFVSFYGKNISSNFDETYKALRTDFSRDYGVKFVMYNDLMLERNILPNKLDSFVFTLTAYIPRTMWSEKPYPYAVYFTNSVFGNFGENNLYGWGLTTSIFSESISNLGYFGLFFGPFLIFVILRKEAKSTNPIFKLLSIIIAILLLLVQAVSFMPLILVYLILLIREKNKKKLALTI